MTVTRNTTDAETRWLLAAAAVAYGALNFGVVYGLVHRELSLAVVDDPVGLAAVLAAIPLVLTLAWTFARGRFARLQWGWFAAFALIGGLVFALPVAVLWPAEKPALPRMKQAAAG